MIHKVNQPPEKNVTSLMRFKPFEFIKIRKFEHDLSFDISTDPGFNELLEQRELQNLVLVGDRMYARIRSNGENDEDLKLEDLDSDSVANLQDEFGASNNGGDDYDDMIPVMNRSQNNLLLTFYFSLFHLQIIKLLSWESRARRQLIRRSTASLASSSPRATAPSA